MTDLSNAQLSGQMSALLVSWQAREDQYRAWTGGTANGGPNADGRYQLTDSAGITRLVECPALLASTVSGPAAAALAHKLETIVARDVSISEATRSAAQRVLSEAALAAAVLARNQAQLARDQAQNSESNAAVHAETASVAASSSTAAYLGTQADREATTADAAAADADRILAQAAATAAAADRAAINPVQFATRADGLSQIVGLQAALDAKLPSASFTWSGLAGKPSTFAPSAHSHVIADTTGLQAALDAKLATSSFTWSSLPGKPTEFAVAAHVHDASAVTSGVFDIDRIPILPSQVQQMSSGDLTALTAPQQTAIKSGTIVTTTDGSRYVYSGSGSKTLEASYVMLADVTPDWNTISGKPSTFAPSAHSHVVADVTGLQAALDGKQAAGSYAAASHGHVISDVTGLQAALDAKVASGSAGSLSSLTVGAPGGTTGIIYLGQNQTSPAYLYWNGGSYAMPSGPLLVNGSTVWTAATFDPATKANASHSHDWAQVTDKPSLLSQVASIDNSTIDTFPDYGITTVGYPGFSKTLLAFNPGGSTGQVQQEFFYNNSSAGYWRVRNKQDSTTWHPWKHVLLHNDATAPLTGTIWTSTNFDPASKANLSGATFAGDVWNSAGGSFKVLEANASRANQVYLGADGSGGYIHSTYGSGGTSAFRVICEGSPRIWVSVAESLLKNNLVIHNEATFNARTSGINVHRPSAFGQYASLAYDGDTAYLSTTYTGGGAGGYGAFVIQAYDNGGTPIERLRIARTTGNFGIGLTADAASRLQINYANPASVPAAGAGGHVLAAGTSGYGLAAGVLTDGTSYIQSTRWDGTATNYPLMLQPNGGVTRVGDDLRFDKVRSGMVGVYDPTQTQAVWAMGPGYVLNPSGASNVIGNLYGLAWSYEPNYGGSGNNPQSKAGLNHQLLLMQNGDTSFAAGVGIWTSGRIECAGNGGWTMGSYADKNRIDYDGSKFRFLNSGNANAAVEMNALTAHGHATFNSTFVFQNAGNFNAPATFNSDLVAASGTVYTSGGLIYSSNWWRSTGTTGWFNATYSTGIWSTQAGEVRTYNGSRFHSEGNLSSGGVIISAMDGGFQNAGYGDGRNRIWSFANADSYGLSYMRGTQGWSSMDTISMHFGTATDAGGLHKFRSDGVAAHAGDLYVKGTRLPVFTSSTGAPSGGTDGDIHVTY